MNVESALDRLHSRVVAVPGLHPFAAFCRLSLAVGFIAPGLTKVLGLRFAPGIPKDSPMGVFFDAFFAAAPFYSLVGWTQIIAGTLLLFHHTAALGALLYLPVIINIFVITASFGFGGTEEIAALMVMACLFVLCWHYPQWKGMIFPDVLPTAPKGAAGAHLAPIGRVAWWCAVVGGLGYTGFMRGLVPPGSIPVASLGLLTLAPLLWIVQVVRARRASRPIDAVPGAHHRGKSA